MKRSWNNIQIQGTHCTGKTGKMAPKNVAKTQGIWFAQVVNSLILKENNILIYAVKIPNFFLIFVCVIVTNDVKWHRENLRSDREKTENTGNLKMQF